MDYVDRCNPRDAYWLRLLLARQPVKVNGHTARLDQNTRVIASITTSWLVEKIEYVVPQWLEAVCQWEVVVLAPLATRTDDVLEAIEWFSWKIGHEDQSAEKLWSKEAKNLLLGRQWPGGLEELRDVVRTLMAARAGDVITLEVCQRVLARYQSPGMKPTDTLRRQECYDYSRGLLYMGRQVHATEIYSWVEQFSRVARNRRFDPWLIGLRIVRDVSNKYYYSSDRLRILIRNAYSSLCIELADQGYVQDWTSAGPGDSPPRLHALLINPLGQVKSAAGVLPHMAHLLGAGSRQGVVSVEEVAARLIEDEKTQMILFCDDFVGTGQQILKQIIQTLASDKVLRGVCESRSRKGHPVALGIVVGVGFADALSKIRMSGPKWLPVFVHAGELLEETDRAFSGDSSVFPETEIRAWAKTLVVDQVGGCLSPSWPGGFGDMQALVVTADNTPNDTLPAIWKSGLVNGLAWRALFERASSPSG